MLSRVVLFGVFLVGSAALANAMPLDSPDTVYIDGTPCNRACQAYMAWSRQVLSGRAAAQSPAGVAAPRAATTVAAKPKPAAHDPARQAATTAGRPSRDKVARTRQPDMGAAPVPVTKPADMASRAVANPAVTPPAVTGSVSPVPADSSPAPTSPADPSPADPSPANPSPANPSPANASAANPSPANKPVDDIAATQPSTDTAAAGPAEKPAERTAGLQQPTLASTPPDSADHAAPPSEPPANTPSDAGSKSGSTTSTTTNSKPAINTKRLQDQVTAATALAEQLTSTTAAGPELRAMNGSSQDDKATISTGSSAVPSPEISETWVVLVISRPDIKAVADLAGKDVAIDGKRSGSANDVRVALVAAGATEVHVSSADTKAIERVMNGEVPAAVLSLVSPDAAETFPEIGGYKVFRVPLSPSSKAPKDKP
jgi:hypothetical protein